MSYFGFAKGQTSIASGATSESDDLTILNERGSSTSLDQSSLSSSLPWADDAIKQNQEDWESVERILYGEQELPDDPKICGELTEWMTVFPHLRVIGKAMQLHDNPNPVFEPYLDEFIAIDYPNETKHSRDLRADKLVQRTYSVDSNHPKTHTLHKSAVFRESEAQRPVVMQKTRSRSKTISTTTSKTFVHTSQKFRVIELRPVPDNYLLFKCVGIVPESTHQMQSSKSARDVRMPSVVDFKLSIREIQSPYEDKYSKKLSSAKLLPISVPVVLPNIHSRPQELFYSNSSGFNRMRPFEKSCPV